MCVKHLYLIPDEKHSRDMWTIRLLVQKKDTAASY